MRTPLSWLRDFAPFPPAAGPGRADPAEIAASLDDLGLVVEGIERVGEGIDDVVVARVEEIAPIAGADRIRLATVDAGEGPLEVVCGAWNFAVGDLVPLAPVGAVLPGDFAIGRRKLKGVVSNGMLCSGRELRLSDDHEGILVLSDVDGAQPGLALAEALGIEPDIVFDIAVEGDRPDAWSVAGVARDLAARLGLPFELADPKVTDGAADVASLASLVVEDRDLCPRMTVRVMEGVEVGASPAWLARRLVLAGMRPVNSVVDASNYVMLELGQPTHPYDLDRVAGGGLLVRRARRAERVRTLDGVERTLGVPGRGLGDTGEDCLICDAGGAPIGIGGIMGGESTEIGEATTRVLLEAAYFTPMAIARTSKRLGLRTEASARFERGCDPWGIDRASARVCELLGAPVARGVLDERGDVPGPGRVRVPTARVRALLGVDIGARDAASLIEPIGFASEEIPGGIEVTVPTFRPDIRPEPHGVADVIEEIARTYGYSRIPRVRPAWPEPGELSARQRARRTLADALAGLGALEAWTPSLVDDADHRAMGLGGPAVAVANPIVREESWLRRSMLPGLVRAVAYNAKRRQGSVRLFEIGTVFSHPDERGRTARGSAAGGSVVALPGEREMLCAAFAHEGDDARTAVAVWRALAETLCLGPVGVVADMAVPGLHPTRAARLVAGEIPIGALGEVDPAVCDAFEIESTRVGWLELDLDLLLDDDTVPRCPDELVPVSRFPSADVDLAFVVPDDVPAARIADALRAACGDLLEAVDLFDVYRGEGVPGGLRGLAFRLRFAAHDRTLTDAEVGSLRQAAIDAATAAGAVLR